MSLDISLSNQESILTRLLSFWLIFLKTGIHSMKAGQILWGIELQEKKAQKD